MSAELTEAAMARVARLACWTGDVELEPLSGGLTNVNLLARCHGEKYFVRVAADVPHHNIVRAFEVEACKAAHTVKLSPEVVHSEPFVLVTRFIEGVTLTEKDVREVRNLEPIITLMQRCHGEMARHWQGPIPTFSSFAAVHNYVRHITERQHALAGEWSKRIRTVDLLSNVVGAMDSVVCHNDLLAANFIHDGERIWLIDWEYAGLNIALSDLAFLSANSDFSPSQNDRLLECYFDRAVTDELRRQCQAMVCVSALREAAWSMVQELEAAIDHDYESYTLRCLARYETELSRFLTM